MGYMIKNTLIQNYLAKNFIDSKAQSIYFNMNVIFQLKMMKNWYFDKYFLYIDKNFFGFRNKKIYFK